MEFPHQDIFVGVVAIVIGAAAFLSGVTNWEPSFRLPKARLLEGQFGRRGSRIFYAAIGLVLIALGAAIIAGFAPNASPR